MTHPGCFQPRDSGGKPRPRGPSLPRTPWDQRSREDGGPGFPAAPTPDGVRLPCPEVRPPPPPALQSVTAALLAPPGI